MSDAERQVMVGMWGPSAATERKPCWHCHHFAGMTTRRIYARCVVGGALSIQAAPDGGCAFFEREPGADDEPGPPGGPPDPLPPLTPRHSTVRVVEWAP